MCSVFLGRNLSHFDHSIHGFGTGSRESSPFTPGLAEGASMMAAGNPPIAVAAVRSYLESEGLSAAPSDPSTVLKRRIDQATGGELGGELLSALSRATLLGRSFTLRPLQILCAVSGDLKPPAQ